MKLRILASRHAAFYSPLIAAIAGGFLKAEGLDADYGTLQPGQTSQAALTAGAADVVQSAVSSNWKPMERGESPLPVHFAQINCRDGFFLVGRASGFEWRDLEGKTLLADHGLQPVTMLKYAVRQQGVDWSRIHVADAGAPERMAAAFRSGSGDFVHLQGPAPQALELDGAGYVVAAVGAAMPPVAFSSLCCSRAFLETDACRAFLRAFAAAKAWVRQAPPEQVAQKEAPYFPGVDTRALAGAIRAYQELGCWEGGIAIPRGLYEQSLHVFESAGAIGKRHAYDDVCVDLSAAFPEATP
jgi:NitT/TauT family transport system substrate-binding protein